MSAATMSAADSLSGPIRWGVIGAGALGGLYGAMLARSGQEVHFLFNSDAEHVRRHGLRIDSKLGDFHLAEVNVHDHAATMPACDVTIVALKTTNNHLLSDLLPPPTRQDGVVLCLQNGLHVERDSAAVVGENRVLGGCCFLCSNKVGPGHIRHLDYGRIVFGEYAIAGEGVSPRVQSIAAQMRSAGIDAVETGNVAAARWRKLMWNIPFNGLSVALDASTPHLIGFGPCESLASAIMHEVHGAAAACGIALPDDAVETTLRHTREMVPYDSSMRLDYLAGRPMELNAIFAAPLAAAQAAGYAMPRVEMLHQQLQSLENRRSG
ncbi:MAG: putative 2-dehydropantoate 2-reductase [Planctomycetota bacterium]